jgi:hypothetical protein
MVCAGSTPGASGVSRGGAVDVKLLGLSPQLKSVCTIRQSPLGEKSAKNSQIEQKKDGAVPVGEDESRPYWSLTASRAR